MAKKFLIIALLAGVSIGSLSAEGGNAPDLWNTTWPVERKVFTLIAIEQGFAAGLLLQASEDSLRKYLTKLPAADLKGFFATYESYVPSKDDDKFYQFGVHFMDDYFNNHDNPMVMNAFLALILRWHDTTK